jgi:hypothetical protein
MRKTRKEEAVDYMRSKRWLCAPSKVAIRHDALSIVALPPDFTKSYEASVRRAVRSVLERGTEGFLLLTNRRSTVMSYAARSLARAGREIQLATRRLEGVEDPALIQYAFEAWKEIERDPARRVSLNVTTRGPDGKEEDDELLFTGVSPAYPDWHPRHFPMDALAATKMSTINAISASVSARIYQEAGLRAGGEYSTGFFLADPFEATRSASAER